MEGKDEQRNGIPYWWNFMFNNLNCFHDNQQKNQCRSYCIFRAVYFRHCSSNKIKRIANT